MKHIRTLAFVGLALASGFIQAMPQSSNADVYTKLITDGRAALASDPSAAFSKAIGALALKADGWEASWLCGDAQLALGLADSAKEFLMQAKRSAPADRTAEIDQSITRLKGGVNADESIRAAEEALTEGLKGKAARLLETAYRKTPKRPDLGLRSLRIMCEVSSELPIGGLRLCADILTHYPSSSEAEEVKRIYDEKSVRLRYEYPILLASAGWQEWAGDAASCLETLNSCAALKVSSDDYDSRTTVGVLRAMVLLNDGRPADALEALKQAVKIGHGLSNDSFSVSAVLCFIPRDHLATLLSDTTVKQYLIDVVGESRVAEINVALAKLAVTSARDSPSKVDEQDSIISTALPNLLTDAVNRDDPKFIDWLLNVDPHTQVDRRSSDPVTKAKDRIYRSQATRLVGRSLILGVDFGLGDAETGVKIGESEVEARNENLYLMTRMSNKTAIPVKVWQQAVASLKIGDLRPYAAVSLCASPGTPDSVIEDLLDSKVLDPNLIDGQDPLLFRVLETGTSLAHAKMILDHGVNPLLQDNLGENLFYKLARYTRFAPDWRKEGGRQYVLSDETCLGVMKEFLRFTRYRVGLKTKATDGETPLDQFGLTPEGRSLYNKLKLWLKTNPGQEGP